jgi:hypothetical protein
MTTNKIAIIADRFLSNVCRLTNYYAGVADLAISPSDESAATAARLRAEIKADAAQLNQYANKRGIDAKAVRLLALSGDGRHFVEAKDAIEQIKAATAHGVVNRAGRLPKDESEARRAAMLAMLIKHPSMKDDIPALAREAGVNERTARRWIKEDQKRFEETRAAMPDDGE